MSMITIKCPNTGLEIPTGIDTDSLSFSRLPDVPARAWCPACGFSHVWWKPAARLESIAPVTALPAAPARG
jgi:hypothetical protein